jgi:hypothetical protein
VLFRIRQPGVDWITFYIPDDILKFLPRTNPVVVRFLLPERHSGASENSVCHTTGPPLEPPHDARHGGVRSEDHVDVVGHDDPGVEIIEAADLLTVLKGIFDHAGHASVL